jgi:integrase
LWSPEDVCRLLEVARALRPPLRSATYQALFGLLAVSGMRVGEAAGLEREDVDLQAGVVTIRHAKFDRSRLVPLHPTATEALTRYAGERDRLCPRPATNAFFLSAVGTKLDRSGVAKTLRKLTTAMGVRTETVHPRAHDLRHSRAVDTLLRWHQSGVSVDAHIATLSTYLGHVSPTKGSQTVFAGQGACRVCCAGCRWPGGVASAPVVRAMLHLTGRPSGVVVERDPQVNLDSPAGDVYVVDDEA